jgi:hypothetical protein
VRSGLDAHGCSVTAFPIDDDTMRSLCEKASARRKAIEEARLKAEEENTTGHYFSFSCNRFYMPDSTSAIRRTIGSRQSGPADLQFIKEEDLPVLIPSDTESDSSIMNFQLSQSGRKAKGKGRECSSTSISGASRDLPASVSNPTVPSNQNGPVPGPSGQSHSHPAVIDVDELNSASDYPDTEPEATPVARSPVPRRTCATGVVYAQRPPQPRWEFTLSSDHDIPNPFDG